MKIYFIAVLLAFALSFLLCLIFIPLLRRMKAGQNILVYVKEHKAKSGTPTMGGLAFILATIFASAICIGEWKRTTVVALAIGLAYMIVGFLDDFLKMKHKENLGLRAWQKFAFQVCIAVISGIYCIKEGLTLVNLPFSGVAIDIGIWMFPLSMIAFLGTVNAVNLTDGLDGLASGVSVPFFAALGVLTVLQKGNTDLAVVSFALVGALLAYLLFNVSPAGVFMGDTGSLALGGFASAVATFGGNVLFLPILGALFVFSVISVILQVIYYKISKGKRIFLMAPVHHHFQEKGFSETKISYAYFVITLFLGLVCIVTAV